MQPAIALVLSLCRTTVSSSAMARAEAVLAGPIDWDHFFARAEAWQVEPLVMMNIRKHFQEAIPAAVLERAAVRERNSRATALARTLVLADLTSRFEQVGIPVIVLKGPALGIYAYGDASLRSFADSDLFVHGTDIVRARDLLIAMGYTRDYEPQAEADLLRKQHALEFSRPGSKVELHCTLLSKHLRFRLEPADIWKEATTTPCPGGVFRVLSPHHQFLFVCAHGTKHEWVSLHWICDVAQLAGQLDDAQTSAVCALAGALHARRILALGMRVARDVVGLERSPFAPECLVPERDTADLVQAVKRSFNDEMDSRGARRFARIDPNLELLMYWVKARERPLDRIASLAHVAFVPTYNDGGAGLSSWLLRPIRLGMRALRVVSLGARRDSIAP